MAAGKKTPPEVAPNREKDPHAGERIFTFGGSQVAVSHPDKIYFPAEGLTKEAVIEYYIAMSGYILPYLKGRALSLFRNPDGIDQPGFFQKDVGSEVPPFAETYAVTAESTGKIVHYFVCNNLASLVYLNNLGCIEINPWHSRVDSPGNPDYLIIDIDPSGQNTFDQVIEVALAFKEVFDRISQVCFCKTSGATGMHIYVPAARKYPYEDLKDFAHQVCVMVNKQMEASTTLQRSLSKRDRSQIYLDYLQNSKSQTIASVYSLRPRPGATVSTPLDWKEVRSGLTPGEFTINNTLQRLEKTGDLFNGVFGKGIDLKKSRKLLGA